MKHLGLFEGIGGFSLAARWMGWDTVAWCKWDEYCQKILKKHFPNAKEHSDITKTDFTGYSGKIDILTGGFPCQPYSSAGKRKGIEDERHLWPEMLRAISEIKPRWIVGENVLGIVNWGGGMVFEQVHTDLENEGYEVQAFVLPSCGKDAPHKRERVWFVAHSVQGGLQTGAQRHGENVRIHKQASNGFSSYPRFDGALTKRDRGELRAGDGIPNWMDRIGSLGNSITPQVAFEIFKAIQQTDRQ